MADIEINLKTIDRKLSNTSRKVTSKCSQAYDYANRLKAELPYKIKNKNQINEKLTTLKSNCRILENNFNRLEKTIIKVLNRYVEHEQNLTSKAKNIKPKVVKTPTKITKSISKAQPEKIKVNYADMNSINGRMNREFISNFIFNKNIQLTASNYDSGVCAAVMMECEPIIGDRIQVDYTYYFDHLNTQKVVPNNIEILNDANINENRTAHTRTINEILGVSNSSKYVNSVYIIEHVNNINDTIKEESVLDHTDKEFSTNSTQSTTYAQKEFNLKKEELNSNTNMQNDKRIRNENNMKYETLENNVNISTNGRKNQNHIQYENIDQAHVAVENKQIHTIDIEYEDII